MSKFGSEFAQFLTSKSCLAADDKKNQSLVDSAALCSKDWFIAMLLLLFHVDEEIYAIESTQIIEVLPLVMLRKIHQVPNHVAGVFNYRSSIVPVIDLCILIKGESCRSRYSTRLIMAQYTTKHGDRAYVGLLAERVTETLEQPNPKPSAQNDETSYLGEVIMHEKGMIQRLHWESLISDVQNVALIAGGIR